LLRTHHHRNCKHYEAEIVQTFNDLLNGVLAWSADIDGVHEDCWTAFKAAARMVNRSEIIREGQR